MIQTKSVKENTNIIFHLSIVVWSNRHIFLAGLDIINTKMIGKFLFPFYVFFYFSKFHFCSWTKISERVFRRFYSINSEKYIPKFSFKAKKTEKAHSEVLIQGQKWKHGRWKRDMGVGKINFQTTEPFWPIPLSHTRANLYRFMKNLNCSFDHFISARSLNCFHFKSFRFWSLLHLLY
jgi:hypothetical protein